MKINRYDFNWKEVGSQKVFERYTSEFNIEERFILEVDSIINSFKLSQQHSLLDYGCGNGKHAIELARRGYSICGYDISSYYIGKAKFIAENNEARVNFFNNLKSLQLLNKKFDFIYTIKLPISYMEDDEILGILEGINKLLKDTGHCLFNFPYTRENREKYLPENHWEIKEGKYHLSSITLNSQGMKEEKYIVIDPQGEIIEEWTDTCRYRYLEDILDMFKKSGFQTEYCCSGLSGIPSEDKAEINSIYCRKI